MMIRRFVSKLLRKILPQWIVIRLMKVRDLSKLNFIDRRKHAVMIFKNSIRREGKKVKSNIDELISLFSKNEYNRVAEIYESKSNKIVIPKAHLIA